MLEGKKKVVLPKEFEGHPSLPTLEAEYPLVEFLVDPYCPKGKAFILDPNYFNPDPFEIDYEWVTAQEVDEDLVMTAKLHWVGGLIINDRPKQGKFSAND